MKRTFEEAEFSSDEELEKALVQALDQEEQLGFFDENDEAWEHAMVRALDRTFNEAHRATTEKLKRLKETQEVKKVKHIWECEWKTLKQ